MKKIYFSLVVFAFTFQLCKAQLSLTKAFNEPVIGNVYNKQHYDSTTAVPKVTGTGQTWNFTSLTPNTFVETSTYTTVASTPSPAVFPAATLAETMSGTDNTITMFKSTGTTFEFQGLHFVSEGVALNFSNTGVFATWPVNFGYNNTDQFGGSATSGTLTASFDGFLNVAGAGTGTVVMPGGLTLANCLQVIVTLTVNQVVGTSTETMISKEYTYYHSSTKFAVLSCQYQTTTSGTVTSKDFYAYVNTDVVAGLSQRVVKNNLSVFPNPTNDMIAISLDNVLNDQVNVRLTNMLGQVVKSEELGTDTHIEKKVNVSTLAKGIYTMNVTIGKTSSVRKIIIN